jgi:hypothetical protein
VPDVEHPHRYVNLHAFVANLCEHRLLQPMSPALALLAQREALEWGGPREWWQGPDPEVPIEVYVMAAAQYILWSGQSLFKHVIYPDDLAGEDLLMWTPGPLFTADRGEGGLSLARWHFWRNAYRAVAVSSAEGEKQQYHEECRNVAARAVAVMDALEMSMSFR